MLSLRSNYFKTKKPRQFSYLPRFYDERKEKLAERRKQIEGGSELSSSERESRMRMAFMSTGNRRNHSSRTLLGSNTNRIVLILGLIFIAFFTISKLDLWDYFF